MFVSDIPAPSTSNAAAIPNGARAVNQEKRFQNLIKSLGGDYKLKRCESYLFSTFYKVKLSCKTDRFEYETIVIGDEYDDDAEARQSVFWKACCSLDRRFYLELREKFA